MPLADAGTCSKGNSPGGNALAIRGQAPTSAHAAIPLSKSRRVGCNLSGILRILAKKIALRSPIPAWLHPAGSFVSTGAESQILSPLPLFCRYGSRPPPGCNARRDFLVACAQRPPAAVSLLRNASKQQGKLPNLGTLPRNSNRVLRLCKKEGKARPLSSRGPE